MNTRRKLVVVSNRIPVTFTREEGTFHATASSGGLIRALEPLLKEHGGTWVGSAGTEDHPEIHRLLEEETREHAYRYAPIFLTEEEQAKYYEGFSNEVVWPLFHDLQSRCVFDPGYWEFYQQVNRKFAEAVEQASGPDDLVWIQDYQLMQVAACLRARRPRSTLAFFLHIPFPPPDIFEKLPWRRQILEGLLQHDLVGVQTSRDQRNLIACLRSFVPQATITGRGESRIITNGTRRTHVQFFPISIDFAGFAESAASSIVVERWKVIRQQAHGMQIVVGIDRLDYTKGILERLRALRAFLRTFPEFRRRLLVFQVVVPSRETIPGYQELKADVEQLVAQVNGEFDEPGWVPINYLHRSIAREEMIAMYRAADLALVTPLKDGMNLVAKEYCACQIDQNGVLILSEFAGAAPELHIGALLVNPYDEVGIAMALRDALNMPPEERRRRMRRMRAQIRKADILTWRDRFFSALDLIETA